MAFSLTDLLGGSVGSAVSDIIGRFKASPDKVLEMQEMVAQNQSVMEQKQLELQEKLQDAISREVEAASANIKAEESSGDHYTARARPTFLYIVEFILLWNYVICRFFSQTPFDLPTPLMWLFGSCVLGYTGARTWEKFMGLPGDSAMQFGSFKVYNKQ